MKSKVGKSTLLLLIVALAIGLNAVNCNPAAAKHKTITLRVADPFPPPPADNNRIFVHFAERVKERAGDRVDFKYYWGGSLVSAPETLSMLSNKSFDIGIVSWLYHPGITPLGTMDWAVPFNTTDCRRSLTAKKRTFEEIPAVMEELTRHNIMPLLWFPMKPYWLYTKFPVTKLEDFKGKKIGASGRDIPVYVKATGAIPVSNVVAEKYEMLQRGVTEGDCMDVFMMTDYKVYEVVKYLYATSVNRAVTNAFCIHKDSWNALPENIQTIMLEEAAAAEKWECQMEAQWMKENFKKWRDAGVKIGTLPEKEVAKWGELIKGHPQKWANELEAKSLPGKKVIKRYIEILEELGEKMPIKYTIK